MKRFLAIALMLSGLIQAQSTLTTLTGTIKQLSGATVTTGRITFTLNAPDTTIPGVARFVPTTVYCGISATGSPVAISDGVSPCTVTSNTAMTPSGTSYAVCVQPQFVQPGGCFNFYALAGQSIDISTIAPSPSTMATNYAGIAGPPGQAGPPGVGCGAGAGAACVTTTPAAAQIITPADGVNTSTLTSNTIAPGAYFKSTANKVLPPGYYDTQNLNIQQDSFGPGADTGFLNNAGGLNPSSDDAFTDNKNLIMYDNSRRMGISQMFVSNCNPHKGGDAFCFYTYADMRNAWKHAADEGSSVFKINGSQGVNYPDGTIVSTTGTGDRSPVLSVADVAPEMFIIDTSKTVATGTITAYATVPFGTGPQGTPMLQPVSTTLVPSSICDMTGPIHQGAIYGSPSTDTVGCTTSQGTITTGVAWAVSVYPHLVERVNITAVSGTNLTIAHFKAHGTGTHIIQGGTNGLLSLDKEAAYNGANIGGWRNGWKTAVYVFGAKDTSNLITGVLTNSGWGQTWPIFGYTMSGVGDGFHIYPGAEVLEVGDAFGTLKYLGFNDVPWAAGDSIENPNDPSQLDQTVTVSSTVRTPALPGSGAALADFGTRGEGVNAEYKLLRVRNENPYSLYFGGGGTMTAPSGTTLIGPNANTGTSDIPLGGQVGDNCGATPAFWCFRGSAYTGLVDFLRFRDRSQAFGFNRTANRFYFSGGVDALVDVTTPKLIITGGNQPLRYAGFFSSTAATSDVVTVAGLTTTSYCTAQQMGSAATISPQPQFPIATAGQITIYHGATAGVTVIVSCNIP